MSAVDAFCPGIKRRRSRLNGVQDGLAEALAAEVVKRSLDVESLRSPSPLLPPDKVVLTVLEALKRPDVPEFEAGLSIAFAFSEPDPRNSELRSSWAWGHLRGRCDWSTRGLPMLDASKNECTGYDDEEECSALYGAMTSDELFLDKAGHADEIRIFFSTLLHHTSARITAPPRWGASDLAEFDFVVSTDIAGASGSIDLLARFLLHRGGPKADTWYIRGLELLGERPAPDFDQSHR